MTTKLTAATRSSNTDLADRCFSMEGVSPTPPDGDAAAAPPSTPPVAQSAAEQARVRKERREAKIKAGGSARLGRITSMGGRLPEPVQAAPGGPSPSERSNGGDPAGAQDTPPSPPPGGARPCQQPQQPELSESLRRQQAERRRVFVEMAARERNPPPNPGPGFQPRQRQPNIDYGQVLDMMVARARGGGLGPDGAGSGLGGGPGQSGGAGLGDGPAEMPAGMPPGLASLLGAQRPPGSFSSTTDVSQAASPNKTSNMVWRVVHALSIILLGTYILQTTAFTGTQPARSRPSSASSSHNSKSTSADDDGGGGDMSTPQAAPVPFEVYVAGRRVSLFTLFMTIETVLQTARFFIEKGRLSDFSSASSSSSSPSSASATQSETSVDGGSSTIVTSGDIGIVTSILQGLLHVLSEPYRGYLRLLIRYALIFSTMLKDALVLVFVLGVGAWLRT